MTTGRPPSERPQTFRSQFWDTKTWPERLGFLGAMALAVAAGYGLATGLLFTVALQLIHAITATPRPS